MRRGGESKSDQLEEDVHFSEEVLSAAIEFCASPDFEDTIADFKLSYLHVFEEYSYYKSEDAEDVEQSLECTEVFEAYQELVERLLENFTKRHHSTVQEFFRECSDAIEGKFVPLFEEHENKWFVEMILSWMDYKSFFSEMVGLAKTKTKSCSSHK